MQFQEVMRKRRMVRNFTSVTSAIPGLTRVAGFTGPTGIRTRLFPAKKSLIPLNVNQEDTVSSMLWRCGLPDSGPGPVRAPVGVARHQFFSTTI
jgi:hypothetical protein